MTVGTAVAVLVGILALATVLGLLLRRRTGRAVPAGHKISSDVPRADGLAPESDYGSVATLVQFSTPTCARCPGTRRHLDALAARHDGVARLEIDLTERPDLATRFNVMQTPTVLLLDADRSVHTRFGGPPRPPELAAALDTVLATSATGPQESR
ncbi:TlpA family protein disulfide reductase [Curtobacterium flaccumfaciens]|uniref:TlpA family protein disulfide reductase n=1 Tax=Curtobacterium flaccumfaciens TaxID=2035 RepID=UPI00399EF132